MKASDIRQNWKHVLDEVVRTGQPIYFERTGQLFKLEVFVPNGKPIMFWKYKEKKVSPTDDPTTVNEVKPGDKIVLKRGGKDWCKEHDCHKDVCKLMKHKG